MATSYFNRTLGTSTSRRIFTMSTWVKRCLLSTYAHIFSFGPNPGDFNFLRFNSSNQLNVSLGGDTYVLTTNALYRDTSAWYHVMTAIDTTQTTSSNRVKLYVNGEQVTSFSSASYPTQNLDTNFTSGVTMRIGSSTWGTNELIEGNLASTYLIDGQALTPSSFGETDATTGIWKPKSYSGSYGTNGFFLKFENSASLGTDSSGNGNNFTVSGTPTQTVDTPSNVFATLNALCQGSSSTFSNGNLKTLTSGAVYNSSSSTLGVNRGKWYWEAKLPSSSLNYVMYGIISEESISTAKNSDAMTNFKTTYSKIAYGTDFRYNTTGGAYAADTYGSVDAVNDVIGIGLDLDNNFIYFRKNGTWQNSGVPTSGATGTGGKSIVAGLTYFPLVIVYDNSISLNFGNGYFGSTAITSPVSDTAGLGKFQYAVPAGYYSLCTKNINLQG